MISIQILNAQKNDTVQKASANTVESVVDSSLQSATLQRHASLADGVVQRVPEPHPNLTGMPDNLKSGIESLSGFSMDDVRVHYNSSKPATVQALAYTQGTDIHVAPGQEKCLPHEAWHVAQQMAGRVSPTTNINGMPVNDNAALEHEADVMGEKAVQCKEMGNGVRILRPPSCCQLLTLIKDNTTETITSFRHFCQFITDLKNDYNKVRLLAGYQKKALKPQEIEMCEKILEQCDLHQDKLDIDIPEEYNLNDVYRIATSWESPKVSSPSDLRFKQSHEAANKYLNSLSLGEGDVANIVDFTSSYYSVVVILRSKAMGKYAKAFKDALNSAVYRERFSRDHGESGLKLEESKYVLKTSPSGECGNYRLVAEGKEYKIAGGGKYVVADFNNGAGTHEATARKLQKKSA